MKIYDYNLGEVVEISEEQYNFMEAVIKHSGRIADALKDYPVSDELIDQWRKDKLFWPVLEGHITILIRSHGLSPEYIKDYLLSTLHGSKVPTETQMKAIGHSIRALGMGLSKQGFQGSVTVTPQNTKIVFNDGLDK